MKLAATQVQLESEVVRTSEDIRRRYRENLNWRLDPKEWIYRNIPVQGKTVLDFGCGTGEITTQLAFLDAQRVYALDVTPGLLASTAKRAELDGVTSQVETICAFVQDVEPVPCDVVIAFAVLHHCFPLEQVMPSLIRWLKPGGIFVAVEPVSYSESLEALRNKSGVPYSDLDEGERKLNPRDIAYVTGLLTDVKIVHFHILGRLARIWPGGDRLFRWLDQAILKVPGVHKAAGTALITGRRP